MMVALSHARRGIKGIPKPPRNVNKADFGGIIDDLNAFSMTLLLSTTSFFMGGVGSKAGAIAGGCGMNASWVGELPNALFGSPKAAIGQDSHLVTLRNFLQQLVAQDVMP
jgi:hypothetical protein